MYRLHKLEVIDFTHTILYKKGTKYLNVLVEEVSDRVVLNVIQGVQEEINKGNPVSDRIMDEVIKPRKAQLVEWLSYRVQHIVAQVQDSYHHDIQLYVDGLIEQAVAENKEISRIEMIPIVGGNISQMLEKAISDIVFRVINQAISDLGSTQNKEVIDDVVDVSFDALSLASDDAQLNDIVKDIANQSLELVKDHVRVQQWKEKEKEARKEREMMKKVEDE